jgi:signal transduction histidine kinase
MTQDAEKGNVLIVDDKLTNLKVLSAMLRRQGYHIETATDGVAGMRKVETFRPDLILLDIMMPEMDGYTVCEHLKADPVTADIPVIFISALDETIDKVKAFQVGGVDYVMKPLQVEEVVARVNSQVTLYKQRREIERLREEDRIYFENLSRLREEFAQAATHDLKSPIAVIMGYINLIRKHEDILQHPDLHAYADEVFNASQYMLRLVTDILDYAKIETGIDLHLTPTILQDFLADHVRTNEVLALEKNIDLSFVVPDEPARAMIDEAQMGRVITNLLSNAIKYTPEGGSVELSLQIDEDEAIIMVADNGIGIPDESLPRLFNRFFRVKRKEHQAAKGTGLGLSIVKLIVEQHGGSIGVESKLAVGTAFTVRLPLTSE